MIRFAIVLWFVGFMMGGSGAVAQDSAALYAQKCANCHAKDGSGHTAVTSKLDIPDLRSKRVVEMSDTDIYNSIAHGTQHKEYPHAFLHIGMTEEQIKELVQYVRVLQRSRQQTTSRG